MRAALTTTLCLTAALLASSATPSRADFRVCNASGAQVKMAFGNNDSRYGWTSRGWWTLAPNACQNVLYGDIPPGNYYVYTVDTSNRAISVPENQPGGTFCVKDEAFDLRSASFMTPQNTIACEANALKGVKFRAVEVTETQPTFTYSLVPSSMSVGVSAIMPLIKDAVQTIERPASSPQVVTIPAPAPPSSILQTQPQRPSQPAGTACQRYPNLC
jgi:uncharacterized membrane protein